MSIESKYEAIERTMLGYEDYKDIPVRPSNEAMVPIVGSVSLTASIIRADALPITGNQTFVRAGVYERLVQSANAVYAQAGLTLDVGYGYRALSVQRARFTEALSRVAPEFQGEDRLAIAHRQVAVPEVAGHPAGAAVDVRLLRAGIPVDFGTELWDYREGMEGKRIYSAAPDISDQQRLSRQILRTAMTASGFAPFDGEWWHFSYGDKEWASYYGKPAALYEQIEFRAANV